MKIINCSQKEIIDSIKNSEDYRIAERDGVLEDFLLSWVKPFLTGAFDEDYKEMEENASLASSEKHLITTSVVNLGDGLIVDSFEFIMKSRFLFEGYYYMTDGTHAFSMTKDVQNSIQAVNNLVSLIGRETL